LAFFFFSTVGFFCSFQWVEPPFPSFPPVLLHAIFMRPRVHQLGSVVHFSPSLVPHGLSRCIALFFLFPDQAPATYTQWIIMISFFFSSLGLKILLSPFFFSFLPPPLFLVREIRHDLLPPLFFLLFPKSSTSGRKNEEIIKEYHACMLLAPVSLFSFPFLAAWTSQCQEAFPRLSFFLPEDGGSKTLCSTSVEGVFPSFLSSVLQCYRKLPRTLSSFSPNRDSRSVGEGREGKRPRLLPVLPLFFFSFFSSLTSSPFFAFFFFFSFVFSLQIQVEAIKGPASRNPFFRSLFFPLSFIPHAPNESASTRHLLFRLPLLRHFVMPAATNKMTKVGGLIRAPLFSLPLFFFFLDATTMDS